MRITAAFLSFFCIIFLFGCVKDKTITESELLSQAFVCDVRIEICGESFYGEFIRKSKSDMSLRLTAPEELSGISFDRNGTETCISAFGLLVPFNEGMLPSSAANEVLFSVYAEDKKSFIDFSGENILLRNVSDHGETLMEFDRETLSPIRLINSQYSIEMSFENYKLIQ